MINYQLADLIARLNNCKKETLLVPNTKDNLQFLKVLGQMGLIKDIIDYSSTQIEVQIITNGKIKLSLISKPGKRMYSSYKDIANSIYILRSSKGIISSQTALKLKLGGELLAKVA